MLSNPLVKAAVSGAGGAFLAQYLEPHLLNIFKPETDFAKKAVSAGAVGVASAGIYWVLGKGS